MDKARDACSLAVERLASAQENGCAIDRVDEQAFRPPEDAFDTMDKLEKHLAALRCVGAQV